jgi:hypothetical protein
LIEVALNLTQPFIAFNFLTKKKDEKGTQLFLRAGLCEKSCVPFSPPSVSRLSTISLTGPAAWVWWR